MEEISIFRRSYLAVAMMSGSYDDVRDISGLLDKGEAAALRPPAWFWNRFYGLPHCREDGRGGDYIVIAPIQVEALMRVLEAVIEPIELDKWRRKRIIRAFAVEIPRVNFFACITNSVPTHIGDVEQPGDANGFMDRVLELMGRRDLFSGPLAPWVHHLDWENERGAYVPQAHLFESVEVALDYLYRYEDRLRGVQILGVPAEWAGKRCFTSEAPESSERISA
ncbi:MAG: hypothetical protein RQ897_02250 [Thermoflexus sp.]|nr:hypothetical protein [Thermoflexus sp.]MDT7947152.1 hypothetical protein [Thermoflexus sp.]